MSEATQEQSAALEVTIDGKKTVVRLDSFDGVDAKLCRAETGHPPAYWFEHTDDFDIDIIATLVWLTRRKLTRGLTCEDVLKSISPMNYSVDQTGGTEDDDPEG